MSTFTFGEYEFDQATFAATFSYSFKDYQFTERIQFTGQGSDYNRDVLVRALDLAHLLIGVSYYKAFPTREVAFRSGGVDEWQADFFNKVYQEGLSQFAFENNLTRDDLAHFTANGIANDAVNYQAVDGAPLVLQSGGKDSLLLASLLEEKAHTYTPWFMQNSEHHPAVLDTLTSPLVLAKRQLDMKALQQAREAGGLNGHVPVTFIVLACALVQAILLGKDTVLAAIGHEGEEPHTVVGDLQITHQWSKTWAAEQLFAEYVRRYISPSLRVGSPLRGFSELKITELFVEKCWPRYAHEFSSCNRANYIQGHTNQRLQWCGECPKCANSYLLFAAFVGPSELAELFGGDMFARPSLTETFKGLLGVDDVMKPFECVGEVDELRWAYHAALANGDQRLSFEVPQSDFDKNHQYPSQMIQL